MKIDPVIMAVIDTTYLIKVGYNWYRYNLHRKWTVSIGPELPYTTIWERRDNEQEEKV